MALWGTVTHVSTAAITGAEQGAATRPDIAPMAKAPENRPAVPRFDARAMIPAGTRIGTTSTMLNAASIRTLAMAKYSQGFVLTLPNSVPVSPANTPSAE